MAQEIIPRRNVAIEPRRHQEIAPSRFERFLGLVVGVIVGIFWRVWEGRFRLALGAPLRKPSAKAAWTEAL